MSLLRTGLAYPAGIKAGFDPSHIAVQGQVTGRIFSAVAHNRNMVSLLRGLPGALGATAITFGMDEIAGPTAVFTDNSTTCTTGFSGHTTGTDAVCTMAYIGVFPSAPTATAILNSSNVSNRMAMGIVGGFYNVYVGTAFTDVSSGIPVLTGAPFFLCCSLRTGASSFVLVNLATGKVTTATSAVAFTNNTTDGIFQVGANSQVNSTNLNLSAVMYSPKYLNMSQLLKWAADPWSFWYPVQKPVKVASAATLNITLTASVGTFTETGKSSLFQIDNVEAKGTFLETGISSLFRISEVVQKGTFSEVGKSALFTINEVFTKGTFVLSGQAAQQARPSPKGTFTETGVNALFTINFVDSKGTFTESGKNVLFNFDIPSNKGTFTEAGQVALFKINEVFTKGTFILTGFPVTDAGTLTTLVAAKGTFSFVGKDVLFRISEVDNKGTFNLSGQNTNLTSSNISSKGTFTETGKAVLFTIDMNLNKGTFNLSGKDATLTDTGNPLGLGGPDDWLIRARRRRER